MTLRTRFLLITGVATVALAGVSEWVTYQQTAAFLDAHEALMRHGPEGAALLTLPVAKHLLLVKLTGLRLLNAGVATFALIVLLNVVWARFIADPIRLLRKHINWMSRGTWKTPITIRQRDEMGDLTKAFNALGEQLTVTVQQFATASKLSSLALISQRIDRGFEEAKARLFEVKGALPTFKGAVGVRPAAALDETVEILDRIQARVDAEFYDQLRGAGLRSRTGSPPARTSRTRGTGSRLTA